MLCPIDALIAKGCGTRSDQGAKSEVISRAHLSLRSGVCASVRVPQWSLNPEEPHGANDLDSQAHRRKKGRGGWNGLHLRAPVSGVDAGWQAHEGQGLEPIPERQRERWHHLPGAILRFVWKELQQRQCENGERARAGIRKPFLAGLTPDKSDYRACAGRGPQKESGDRSGPEVRF